MMREHDVDLVIIDWFSDGPRTAPDRLVQQTLAHVQSHPQRSRFSWTNLMSAATLRRPVAPTLRLAFVLATVALVSALLGVYIGSHQRAVIPPVPSPTERASSPTPSAAVSSPVPTPYPVITEIPGDLGLTWTSRAVSGDELWNIGLDGLWHYIDEAWTGPIVPPPLGTESINRLAVGPDGALWVTSETTVAVLRDGSWSRAWGSELGVRALAVAPDGTAWVTQLHELVALRPVAAGYDAKFILCPDYMSRLAVTTEVLYTLGASPIPTASAASSRQTA